MSRFSHHGRSHLFRMICIGFVLATGVSSSSWARCVSGTCNISAIAVNYKRSADQKLLSGNPKAACQEYEKAIKWAPSWTAVRFNLAIAYYQTGDLTQATSTLEELLKKDPTDVEVQYNVACLYLYQKQTALAETHFEQARDLSTSNSRFLPLIDQGLHFLHKLKSLDPQEREAFFALLKQNFVPALSTS